MRSETIFEGRYLPFWTTLKIYFFRKFLKEFENTEDQFYLNRSTQVLGGCSHSSGHPCKKLVVLNTKPFYFRLRDLPPDTKFCFISNNKTFIEKLKSYNISYLYSNLKDFRKDYPNLANQISPETVKKLKSKDESKEEFSLPFRVKKDFILFVPENRDWSEFKIENNTYNQFIKQKNEKF